jgi:hypothetical protein
LLSLLGFGGSLKAFAGSVGSGTPVIEPAISPIAADGVESNSEKLLYTKVIPYPEETGLPLSSDECTVLII